MPRSVLLILATLIAGTIVSAVVLNVSEGIIGTKVSQEGEEFVYEVRWTWFKLGMVHLTTFAEGKAEAQIDTYPNVPFVNLHSVHFTQMDSLFYSHASHSIEKNDSSWDGLDYVYDLPAKRLIVEDVLAKSPSDIPYQRTTKDTIHLPSSTFLDGLSIAYFPRRYIHTHETMTIPTVLYGKLGETTFEFEDRHTTQSIDALEQPVRVVEFEGTTSAVGVYGMTGDFTGWFSDDSAAVPIKGKLKVLIGSVTVELVKWNRKGWNPPE